MQENNDAHLPAPVIRGGLSDSAEKEADIFVKKESLTKVRSCTKILTVLF